MFTQNDHRIFRPRWPKMAEDELRFIPKTPHSRLNKYNYAAVRYLNYMSIKRQANCYIHLIFPISNNTALKLIALRAGSLMPTRENFWRRDRHPASTFPRVLLARLRPRRQKSFPHVAQ